MGVDRCFYCGRAATTTATLPKHHPFGRINSDLIVSTCILCHDEQTNEQQTDIPKRLREHIAPPLAQLLYGELSLSKHLEVLGRERARIIKQRMQEMEYDDSIHQGLHQKKGTEKEK
jgi:hypothetical protein